MDTLLFGDCLLSFTLELPLVTSFSFYCVQNGSYATPISSDHYFTVMMKVCSANRGNWFGYSSHCKDFKSKQGILALFSIVMMFQAVGFFPWKLFDISGEMNSFRSRTSNVVGEPGR